MMNTRIFYLYRDGANYSTAMDVVLPGTLSAEEKQELVSHCDASVNGNSAFIPGQVGLKDLQGMFMPGDRWSEEHDHPWHTLEGVEDTDLVAGGDSDHAAGSMTAREFMEVFLATKWDHCYMPQAQKDSLDPSLQTPELEL